MIKNLLTLIFILFTIFFLQREVKAIAGCFCGDNSSCYSDRCTRKIIKPDGSIDYSLCEKAGCEGAYNACYDTDSIDANRYFCLQQPPCCEEMVKRNDPKSCCWPERGYCHPEYCKQLSRREQCGWYWVWHDAAADIMKQPYGYGCIKGTSPNNLEPVYGLPEIAKKVYSPTPTFTPSPTKITFTPSPTKITYPTFSPTSSPFQVLTSAPLFSREKISRSVTSTPKRLPIFSSPINFPIKKFPIYLRLKIDKISKQFILIKDIFVHNLSVLKKPVVKSYEFFKSWDERLEFVINDKIDTFLQNALRNIKIPWERS